MPAIATETKLRTLHVHIEESPDMTPHDLEARLLEDGWYAYHPAGEYDAIDHDGPSETLSDLIDDLTNAYADTGAIVTITAAEETIPMAVIDQAADFAAKLAPRVKILLAEGVEIDAAIKQAAEEYLALIAELAAGETDRAKAYRNFVFEKTWSALSGC